MAKKTSRLDWFPVYVDDWDTSPHVMEMTTAQEGIYFRLLRAQWRAAGEGLPSDSGSLRRIAQCSGREWAKFFDQIIPKVCISKSQNGCTRLYNQRLHEEWLCACKLHEQAKLRGKKGGDARVFNSRPTKDQLKRCTSTVTVREERKTSSSSRPDSSSEESSSGSSAPDRVDWPGVQARWNDLAEKHGLPKLRGALSDRRRKSYRSITKQFPAWWAILSRELPVRKQFHRDEGYPHFDMACRASWFEQFNEGVHRDPIHVKRNDRVARMMRGEFDDE